MLYLVVFPTPTPPHPTPPPAPPVHCSLLSEVVRERPYVCVCTVPQWLESSSWRQNDIIPTVNRVQNKTHTTTIKKTKNKNKIKNKQTNKTKIKVHCTVSPTQMTSALWLLPRLPVTVPQPITACSAVCVSYTTSSRGNDSPPKEPDTVLQA